MKREGSFRRARAIVRASLSTLRRNPGLLWFPAIAAGLHVTFGALFALAVGLRRHLASLPASDLGVGAMLVSDETLIHASTVAGFLAIIGFQLIGLVTAVALTHASLEALAGRPWTVREAFARVRARRGAIASYAIVRATSGWLLGERRGRRRRRGGKHRRRRGKDGPLRKLARLAWWAATYLVVPVIAHEDRGAFDSIRRSATLFKSTWKEGILGRWTLGWLWLPCTLACIAPVLLCAGLGVDDETIWLLVVLVAASGLGLGGVIISTLDTVYRAALYVFAAEGVIPGAFDVPDLHTVWHAERPPGEAPDDGPESGPTGD